MSSPPDLAVEDAMNAVAQRVQVTGELVRHVLTLLLRGLTTGLVVLGASCWCGYGAYAAWARIGPLSEVSDDEAPADTVEDEAARGIAEIEHYLSCQCQQPGTTSNEPGRPTPPAAESQ